jgi:hypothetical protein
MTLRCLVYVYIYPLLVPAEADASGWSWLAVLLHYLTMVL